MIRALLPLSVDWLPQVFSKSIAAMTVTVTGEPDEFEKIAHKVQNPKYAAVATLLCLLAW